MNECSLAGASRGDRGGRMSFFLHDILGLGDGDDDLHAVGSLELGSPLDNFGDLLNSLPKHSVGGGRGMGGRLPMRRETRGVSPTNAFGLGGGVGGIEEALAAGKR